MIEFLFVNPAFAVEKVVVQASQAFLDGAMEAKLNDLTKNPTALRKSTLQKLDLHVGDSIKFKNLDQVAHNVYSETFDLKRQPPGDSRAVTFDKPGDFTIHCAIHPKMQFTVKVK